MAYGREQTLKTFVRGACIDSDTYEYDMFFNKPEASALAFDYYNGVIDYYRNRSTDPYYNPDTKKRSQFFLRDRWLFEDLS